VHGPSVAKLALQPVHASGVPWVTYLSLTATNNQDIGEFKSVSAVFAVYLRDENSVQVQPQSKFFFN